MQWSPEQERALAAVAEWLKARDRPVFRLFGYAGTGKTTLARHVADSVKGDAVFAAFTGKAAHVMRNKGCRDVIAQARWRSDVRLGEGSAGLRG